MALLSALTTSPMVWPAAVVMVSCLDDVAVRAFQRQGDLAGPRQSRRRPPRKGRWQSVEGAGTGRHRSVRRIARKPSPPREVGVVASSCTTMPLPPVAEMESCAVGEGGAAVGAQRRVQRGGEAADRRRRCRRGHRRPPIKVPAVKSTSTRLTRLPMGSVTAMVVCAAEVERVGGNQAGVAAASTRWAAERRHWRWTGR